MKRLIERFKAPTPRKWRRIGNAIFSASLVITTFEYITSVDPTFITISLVLGAIGKLLTSLFTEDGIQTK